MVLSNKKLKLKLSDELVQSNSNAAAKLFWTLPRPHPDSSRERNEESFDPTNLHNNPTRKMKLKHRVRPIRRQRGRS